MSAPESALSRVSKQFIAKRQDRDYALYAGLLDLAHRDGVIKSIRTKLLQAPAKENEHTAICHASLECQDGRVFEGIGDANPANVTKMVAIHAIRMAETRAKARALRDALNIGGAAMEELGAKGESEDDDEAPAEQPRQQPRPATPRASNEQHQKLIDIASKILNEWGTDLSEHITDDLTAEGADVLLRRFQATYEKFQKNNPTPANVTQLPQAAPAGEPATDAQIAKIHKLQAALGRPSITENGLTSEAAATQIADLVKEFNARNVPAKKASAAR